MMADFHCSLIIGKARLNLGLGDSAEHHGDEAAVEDAVRLIGHCTLSGLLIP
jgi:hypothetical protein